MEARPSNERVGDLQLGSRLWRPPSNRALFVGLVLALLLPWLASRLSTEVSVFGSFPGLTFLAATVTATLMGRLSASAVATLASAALLSSSGLLPEGATEEPLLGLLALGFFQREELSSIRRRSPLRT